MTKQEIHHFSLRSEPSGRFQPTGFPDLGAALYEQPKPNGESTRMLLVESAQSMANHLEAQGWDHLNNQPVESLMSLPWVRVVDKDSNYLTSSRTEAHRLASAFIRKSTQDGTPFPDVLKEKFGLSEDRPVDLGQVAKTIFRLDPFSLVHGVFFAFAKPHQPKITRAITAFIEAEDVREAHSGGVKTDDVRHTVPKGAAGSAEGYGMVPFSRVEYTAAKIRLHTALDLGLLASYGLSQEATDLLQTMARWELATLLSQQIRLRTACSFTVDGAIPKSLTDPSALAGKIASLASTSPELRDVKPVTEIVWKG